MAIRFRKSFKIAPGIRLNLGKKSASVSIGGKGARLTTGTSGSRVSGSIPETGLSYSKRLNKESYEPSVFPTIVAVILGALLLLLAITNL